MYARRDAGEGNNGGTLLNTTPRALMMYRVTRIMRRNVRFSFGNFRAPVNAGFLFFPIVELQSENKNK